MNFVPKLQSKDNTGGLTSFPLSTSPRLMIMFLESEDLGKEAYIFSCFLLTFPP